MNSRLLKCLWAPLSYILFVFLLFASQTDSRPNSDPYLRKQEVYKKHDYTVQITPAAVCLIYTLMISSPSNKSIAVYLWMCSFMWPKAAHLHQTLQWHQCLLVITATCPVHWSINATWVYLLFHWDTDKLKDFILNCQNCFSIIELRRLKPKKSKWHF